MAVLELPEQQLCLSDGDTLTFIEYGFGKTLLLIHGSLCDYRYWRWQMAAMGEYGRVVAPSLRGYWPRSGSTLQHEKFSAQQHASDLIELMSVLSLNETVDVVGHSRGALVAMEMALQAPDMIKTLVLADPGMNLSRIDTNTSFLLKAAEAVAQGRAEDGLAEFIDAVSGADTWRKMTGWFKTMVTDNAATLLLQAQEADQVHEATRFAAIRCPVLLLGGQQSPSRYGKIMDELHAVLPDARRDTVPLASHGMNLANPKSFNRKVLEFLDSQSFF